MVLLDDTKHAVESFKEEPHAPRSAALVGGIDIVGW